MEPDDQHEVMIRHLKSDIANSNSITLKNCIIRIPLSISDSFEFVKIYMCETGESVVLKEFPEMFTGELLSHCSTIFQISDLRFECHHFIRSESDFGLFHFSKRYMKLIIKDITIHTPYKFEFSRFKIEIKYVCFGFQTENSESKKSFEKLIDHRRITPDAQFLSNIAEFDFKFIKQLELSMCKGTICISNYLNCPNFLLIFWQESDVELGFEEVYLSRLTLMYGNISTDIRSFYGTESEFMECYFENFQ